VETVFHSLPALPFPNHSTALLTSRSHPSSPPSPCPVINRQDGRLAAWGRRWVDERAGRRPGGRLDTELETMTKVDLRDAVRVLRRR
jgi:hypothetical protein